MLKALARENAFTNCRIEEREHNESDAPQWAEAAAVEQPELSKASAGSGRA